MVHIMMWTTYRKNHLSPSTSANHRIYQFICESYLFSCNDCLQFTELYLYIYLSRIPLKCLPIQTNMTKTLVILIITSINFFSYFFPFASLAFFQRQKNKINVHVNMELRWWKIDVNFPIVIYYLNGNKCGLYTKNVENWRNHTHNNTKCIRIHT